MRHLATALACAICATGAFAVVAQASEFDQYRIQSASASLSTTQAGAHPDFTTSFLLSSDKGEPFGFTRDVEIALPPGIFGNPQAFPKCTVKQFGVAVEDTECPQDSQVGITEETLGGNNPGTKVEPVYNMPAPGGDVVARLGFYAALYPVIINVRVDPDTYGLIASVEGAAATIALLADSTTLWGVPAAKSHDSSGLPLKRRITTRGPPVGVNQTCPKSPL